MPISTKIYQQRLYDERNIGILQPFIEVELTSTILLSSPCSTVPPSRSCCIRSRTAQRTSALTTSCMVILKQVIPALREVSHFLAAQQMHHDTTLQVDVFAVDLYSNTSARCTHQLPALLVNSIFLCGNGPIHALVRW